MDEITTSQEWHIFRLLEERRVSRATAERIIDLLNAEPPLSATGLENLTNIQRPS